MTMPCTSRAVAAKCVLVALVAAGVYLPAGGFDFISVDDSSYVTSNPHVAGGLTPGSIIWAITTAHAGNWHPLTWISHMIDAAVFGLNAGGHHLGSVALHAANAALLFLFLARATGAVNRSAFVALVFAAHPLNVESVAWVAERKNVLSTLFWLLTMLAYLDWVRRRGAGRYALALALFALGLTAKPMLVTLPIVLLLLDRWPLGREAAGGRALLLEKLPHGALAAAAGVVTLIVQGQGGLTGTLTRFPLDERLANAVVSCGAYLKKMVWPAGLCILYPHPGGSLPAWKVAASGALIAVATGAAFLARRKRPCLTVGWFWYAFTLIPVIGLVQVGQQAMADRYAYVPLIGIFVLVAWGVPDSLTRLGRIPAAAVAGALILALLAATAVQVGHWRNDGTVARRALAVNRGSLPVAFALTGALFDNAKGEEALSILAELPNSAELMNQIGQAFVRAEKIDVALRIFREAVRLDPGHSRLRSNYGAALLRAGDLAGAREQRAAALRIERERANAATGGTGPP